MSVEELWELHQSVISVLAKKITAERAKLEDRLKNLWSRFNEQRTAAAAPISEGYAQISQPEK